MVEKTNVLNLTRQSKLVPPESLDIWNFKLFGIGSIGHTVMQLLAKTGFKNITVYDMDKVEEENIATQGFRFSDIGKTKVQASKDICLEHTGITIETEHGQVTEETEINVEPNTMYLCFFDSIEGRKLVFNKVKDMPTFFIDGRIGRFDMRHYFVDCSDDIEKEEYFKSLPTGKGSELVCGEKASAFINYNIASLIVANIISFVSDKPYTKRFIGNALNHKTDIEIRKEKKENEVTVIND